MQVKQMYRSAWRCCPHGGYGRYSYERPHWNRICNSTYITFNHSLANRWLAKSN